ncbi:unnamed protein product [Ectocarpus sp. CCAP 1310/34]|nr:unnamed protein product [Ectocarpus sp. CCAP 1310/34]
MAGAGKPAGARARAIITAGARARAGIADGARARAGIAASLPARAGIAAGPCARARIESPTALAPGPGSPPAFPPGPGSLPALAPGPGSSVQLLPSLPTLPPKPIREEQPDYADWLLPACQTEMKRRAEAEGHKGAFRYGGGVDEVNTSISSVQKPEAVKLLLAQDAWHVSKGVDPNWKQAPQGTPQAKRVGKEAKAKLAAEEEERQRRCRSSGDAARLCFMVFSDEMYEKALTNEQAPTDRNKRDNHVIGVEGRMDV